MSKPINSTVHVIPSLRYADCAKAIDWLCDAFGFERQLVVPGEDGNIVHAQLKFGNGMLMLGSGGNHPGPFDKLVRAPEKPEQVRPGSIYVVVDDPDAHCTRARAAGAEIILEPESPDHGGRSYTCVDIEGNVWTFGSYDPFAEDQA